MLNALYILITCKRDLVLCKTLLIVYKNFWGGSSWRWLYKRSRNILLL